MLPVTSRDGALPTLQDKPTPSILVLGIGNILLQDEGAGVRVIESLARRHDLPECVDLIDGGTVGVELLPYIEGRSHIIIVDAVSSGNPPGTIVRIDDVPAFFRNKITPHQIGITDVLALAAMTCDLPPHVILIGIEPESLDGGLELSGTVSTNIQRMVEMVSCEVTEIIRSMS